ncbi:hypothetical protein WMF31_13290 [Sorangium sp. So ce1036]
MKRSVTARPSTATPLTSLITCYRDVFAPERLLRHLDEREGRA